MASTNNIEDETAALMIATVALILLREDSPPAEVHITRSYAANSSASDVPSQLLTLYFPKIEHTRAISCHVLAEMVNNKLLPSETEDLYIDALALDHGIELFKKKLRSSKSGIQSGECGLR